MPASIFICERLCWLLNRTHFSYQLNCKLILCLVSSGGIAALVVYGTGLKPVRKAAWSSRSLAEVPTEFIRVIIQPRSCRRGAWRGSPIEAKFCAGGKAANASDCKVTKTWQQDSGISPTSSNQSQELLPKSAAAMRVCQAAFSKCIQVRRSWQHYGKLWMGERLL